MALTFRVELVWSDEQGQAPSSIFLTADGRVVLHGQPVSDEERAALDLPRHGALVSVDRNLIRAIKDML